MPLDRYRNAALVDGIDVRALPLAAEAAAASAPAEPPANQAQPRPRVWLVRGRVTSATGSAYMEWGATKVLCSVHGPMEPKRAGGSADASAEQSRGPLQVYFKLVPFARPAGGRVPFQPDESERRTAAFLQDTLAPSLRLDQLPKSRVEVHCLVLEDAGCCLATAVTCAGLALADAGLEMYDLPTAATVSRRVVEASSSSTSASLSSWVQELGDRSGGDVGGAGRSCVTVAYLRNLRQLAGLLVEAGEPLSPGEVDAACKACVEPCKLLAGTVRQVLMDSAGLAESKEAAAEVTPMET